MNCSSGNSGGAISAIVDGNSSLSIIGTSSHVCCIGDCNSRCNGGFNVSECSSDKSGGGMYHSSNISSLYNTSFSP